MFKRLVILVILSSILIALVVINSHKTNNDSSKYTMVEYEITEIDGDYYYGEGNNGTQIQFSSEKIVSDKKVEVHDVVICFFEKDNLAKGLIKVEKK
jgi:hypothetical protein